MTTTFLNFGPELDAIFADAQKILVNQATEATFETKVLAALAALATALDQQSAQIASGFTIDVNLLNQILAWANYDATPARVRFVVITHRDIITGEPVKMPTALMNDVISNIPLEFDNLVGVKVAAPVGGTITLTVVDDASGNPSTAATVAMGADGMSVDVTPTPSDGTNLDPGFTINFEDMANADLKASLDCNFVSDSEAANVHFVTTGITTRPVGP
jgi:hypothetical protein